MQKKSKIYAKALVALIVKSKSIKEQQEMASMFLEYLEKHREIKKAKEIISLAEKIYFQKTGKKKVILESARDISDSAISKKMLKNGDFVQKRINPALIAGVKIIINHEKQLDFSLKNTLEKVFN